MPQPIRMRIVMLIAGAALAVTGCSAAPPPPEASSPAPSPVSIPPVAPPVVPPTVHPVTAADLGETWRPGCPVAPQDLRRVELDHLGNDGATHRGALVVHRDVVDDVIAIFGRLQQLRYPIEKMRTVDRYPGAQDELSMRDNNTSAFNCRPLPGGTGWSLHAYGRAIDVNPLVNPYISAAGDLEPATAGPYLDRTRDDLGLLRPGDAAVQAFTDRGWRWGGAWRDPIDYQHFEIG
jgi:hypothetical protein